MSSEKDYILSQIKELYGYKAGAINIIDEMIDIDTQLAYFEHPRDFKEQLSDEDIMHNGQKIYHEEVSFEDKKDFLVQLASVNNIKAYKTIENYISEDGSELNDWALLALHESKMLIESSLLNENLVLISTGLGGEGNMLRYFVVLINKQGEKLDDFRKRIMTSELTYILERNNSKLEDSKITDDYYCALCLIPLQESIQELFYSIIEECNNYGNFLRYDYIINNSNVLSCEQIDEIIANRLNSK